MAAAGKRSAAGTGFPGRRAPLPRQNAASGCCWGGLQWRPFEHRSVLTEL